jgi:hypothetical protein
MIIGAATEVPRNSGQPPAPVNLERVMSDNAQEFRYYNTQRAHTARWTKGRTPEQVLGKAEQWHKTR